MSRSTALIFSLILLSLCRLAAQLPSDISQALREAAAVKIHPPQPPAVPSSTPSVTPVAPPMPGQFKAEPAAAPSRIPNLPPPETTVVPSTSLNKNKTVSSTSSSGQFIVHGNDLSLRSAFSSRCEEISTELGKLLRDHDPWALPIVVLLNSGEAAKKGDKAAEMAVSAITHGGFHIQVTINLRPDLRPSDVRSEIIRALLAERILRNQKELTSKRAVLLPDWLYTGVIEALDYRKHTRPSALFAAIFKSGKIFGIEEIIEASPVDMDGLSKTIYQTSCCALVLALLDQPEGGRRLNQFLSSLSSDSRPERDLLNQAFPSFTTSPASLNKWWALQLASLSNPGVSESLSAAETMKALEAALTLHYQAKPSEIPAPQPVVNISAAPPPVEIKPQPKVADTATEPAPTTEAEPTEEKKRSLFSRLNPFGRRKASNDEVIAAAIEETTLKEVKTAQDMEQAKIDEAPPKPQMPEVPPAESEKRVNRSVEREPLFNRWFGESSKPVATPPKETPPKDKAISNTLKEEPVKEIQEDKKPSMLNPANWFRRGRDKTSPKNNTKPEIPAKDSSAPPQPETPPAKPQSTAGTFADWLTSPTNLVAYVYQETATDEPAKGKKRFLGLFGGKKKTEEKPAEENPPEQKMKEADSPKAQPKEEPKVEIAKPIAKPEPKSEAKPQIIEAKPSPEAMPETEAQPASAASKSKPKRDLINMRSLFGPGSNKKKEQATPNAPATIPIPEAVAIPASKESPTPSEKAKSKTGTKSTIVENPGGKGTTLPTDKPDPGAQVTPEAKETTSNPEAMPKLEPETTPATAIPVAPKPKRDLINLRSLFGPAKNKEGEAQNEPAMTPTPVPVAIPANKESMPQQDVTKSEATKKGTTEAKTLKTSEQTQTPEPKPEPKKAQPSKATKAKVPKAKTTTPVKDEPLTNATVSLSNYQAIMKRKDRSDILQHNIAALNALQQRCAVLFRPIVADYTALISELSAGKEKNVAERLKKLQERSQTALNQSKAVRDLLDVSEANSSPSMSGLFEDYMKLPETIQKELPKRKDPVSRYLDALDLEFSKQ